jgi:8-oxo-dGTP pyrophosphatase MutT (NUDIX family)
VLIVRRRKIETGTGSAKLTWAFPGGIPSSYETPQDTVAQEVLEETGYEVEVHELISKRKHPQFPVFVYYFRCELKTSEATEVVQDEEIAGVKWVKPEEIKNYFTSDFDPIVAKFLGLS